MRNGLGRRRPIRLGLLAALALACGCAGPRGAVSIDPAAVGTGAAVPVLVASARAPVAGPAVFGPGRAPLSFARFVVSVPPEREPGSVTYPGRVVDPRTEFVTLEAARLRDEEAFVAAIDRELGRTGHDEAIVFVHGYNNTFAEGLYRQAQLAQDFGLPATSVNFAWPSAAAWDGYPYDKESAILATEGLSRTLDLVASSSVDRVVVACHSMGCFLVLETMRIKALRGDDAFLERLHAVVMLAPDIDVDIFRERMHEIGYRGIPIYIFASSGDRALQLSARLHGRTSAARHDHRLGRTCRPAGHGDRRDRGERQRRAWPQHSPDLACHERALQRARGLRSPDDFGRCRRPFGGRGERRRRRPGDHDRMHEIGYRGIPIYIFASSGDRALQVSARLHGRRARLGMITDSAALADLPVTVIDVTEVKGNDAQGHSTVQTSPVMSALFNGLEDFGPQTISDAVADPSVVDASIDAVGQATTIALRPLESR